MERKIPVVVIKELSETDKILTALEKDGIHTAEITFRTACAAEAIAYACKNYPDMNIGAGTVINAEQCEAALKAGAKFIVSPGFNPKVVKYCVDKGYITGMDATTFAPNKNLTRAQFVTILAKFDGVDLTQYDTTDSGFEDVKTSHWYNEVVCWAVENGITSGLSATKFGPNNNITRSQLARFFMVYTEKEGLDVSKTTELTAFSDAAKVQAWAEPAVKWAVAEGLIAGSNSSVYFFHSCLDRRFECYVSNSVFFCNKNSFFC